MTVTNRNHDDQFDLRERARDQSRWSRETDTMPLWAKILYIYGVPSAIALGLVWVIAMRMMTAIEDTRQSLHDHVVQSSFYMRAMCISLAESAGSSPSHCEPPAQR